MKELVVTDHAVLRYLERVYGLNIKSIKKELLSMIASRKMKLKDFPLGMPLQIFLPATIHGVELRVLVRNGAVITIDFPQKHYQEKKVK